MCVCARMFVAVGTRRVWRALRPSSTCTDGSPSHQQTCVACLFVGHHLHGVGYTSSSTGTQHAQQMHVCACCLLSSACTRWLDPPLLIVPDSAHRCRRCEGVLICRLFAHSSPVCADVVLLRTRFIATQPRSPSGNSAGGAVTVHTLNPQ